MNILMECPVCGSNELVKTGEEMVDGAIFGIHKCRCCDRVSRAYDKYQKEQKAKDKAMLKALEAMAKAKIAAEESRACGTPKDVDELTKGCAVELWVAIGNPLKKVVGTGTMITEDYLLTNAHVVIDIDTTTGQKVIPRGILAIPDGCTDDSEKRNTELICCDEMLDLALLRLDRRGSRFVPAKLRETPVERGERVVTVGNAKGHGLSIFEGIVSDPYRDVRGFDHIMISAHINNGNSGGPVFDNHGKLIGIAVSAYNDTPNMSYVIPARIVKHFLGKARAKGIIDFEP